MSNEELVRCAILGIVIGLGIAAIGIAILAVSL